MVNISARYIIVCDERHPHIKDDVSGRCRTMVAYDIISYRYMQDLNFKLFSIHIFM